MILVIIFHAIAVQNVIHTYLEWCWYTRRSNTASAAYHNRELIIPFLFYMPFMFSPVGYVNVQLLNGMENSSLPAIYVVVLLCLVYRF